MNWNYSTNSYGATASGGESKPPLYVGNLGNRTSPRPQQTGSTTGKVRLATMATAGSTNSPGLPDFSPRAQLPIDFTPGGASRGPTFGHEAALLKTQPDIQPSQKLAGGTLGLPRAGFSSSFRSPSPQPETPSPDGVKTRLSGYYGHNKTGGMSVA